MATSVQELINYLSEVEDKEQPVIYQYYLAEHFSTSKETFEKVAELFDSCIPNDHSTHQVIAETVADYSTDEEE